MRRARAENAQRKQMSIIKKISLISAGILIGITTASFRCNNITQKDSVYQGQVTGFGREGIIWKTYEGRFAIGGENRSERGAFSLDEQARNGENIEELAKQLYRAVETRANVRVYGKEPVSCYPWRSDTGYHITKVEFLDK